MNEELGRHSDREGKQKHYGDDSCPNPPPSQPSVRDWGKVAGASGLAKVGKLAYMYMSV